MKNVFFIAVILFLGGMTTQAASLATEQVNVTLEDHGKHLGRHRQNAPIVFVQRGVKFFVYSNGTFDFRIRNRNGVYGRRGYGAFQAPGNTYGVSYVNNNRRFVRYNVWGEIVQVGRNGIFYNRRGKVNQIGNVSLRYRQGRLVRVGDMFIRYNRNGRITGLDGYIFPHNPTCGFCGVNSCTMDHFSNVYTHDSGWNWDNNDWDDDWFEGRRTKKNKRHNHDHDDDDDDD